MISLEAALRATEVLLALALIQQGAEHLVGPRYERWLFGLRMIPAALVLAGWSPAVWGLLLCGLVGLSRFDGPYNGGSDRMGFLVLACLCLAWVDPELALAYLAVQLTLSYFVSGLVKLRNPEWLRGRALSDVFRFSAYPVSENLRTWAGRRALLLWGSLAVILFEVAFPLSLAHPVALILALVLAFGFHLANAMLFGLNRFVWSWLAAYPSLVWFQGRLFG